MPGKLDEIQTESVFGSPALNPVWRLSTSIRGVPSIAGEAFEGAACISGEDHPETERLISSSMNTLSEIEAAVKSLPMRQQEALFTSLAARLSRAVSPDLRENSYPSTPPGHSVLDISPVYLGGVLRPLSPDDDLLGEMLEDRR